MITPSIFIDIDTQESFFRENDLVSAEDIKSVRANLKKLTAHALAKRIKIISLIDDGLKIDKAVLKKDLKKLKETVVDEKATQIGPQEKIADLKKTWKKSHQLVLQKTGFDVFTNPNFLKLIKASRIKNIIVYGYGIDFGIEKAVVNLVAKGYKIWIPVDAVLAINELNREPSVKEMHRLGVQMWNSEFVIANT